MVAAAIRMGLLSGMAILSVYGIAFCQNVRPYDFQKSPEYLKLTPIEKSGVMKVHHDLVLLWCIRSLCSRSNMRVNGQIIETNRHII